MSWLHHCRSMAYNSRYESESAKRDSRHPCNQQKTYTQKKKLSVKNVGSMQQFWMRPVSFSSESAKFRIQVTIVIHSWPQAEIWREFSHPNATPLAPVASPCCPRISSRDKTSIAMLVMDHNISRLRSQYLHVIQSSWFSASLWYISMGWKCRIKVTEFLTFQATPAPWVSGEKTEMYSCFALLQVVHNLT